MLAVKGLKPAHDGYSGYRDKKVAELYDTIQETKKVVAAQNEAAKDAAPTRTEDVREKVSDARRQFAEQTDELTNKIKKKSKQAEKDTKLRDKKTRCKTRYEVREVEKRAKKACRDLEVHTQKAIDKVTGKEEQHIENGHIAIASLASAVVAATVGAVVWKLCEGDKFPVDLAPYRQKVEALKTRAEDRAAEVKGIVEEKAPGVKGKAEKAKDKAAGKADEAKDKTAEAKKITERETAEVSKQAQIKVDEVKAEKKNADDAREISSKSFKPTPKPGQVRKK